MGKEKFVYPTRSGGKLFGQQSSDVHIDLNELVIKRLQENPRRTGCLYDVDCIPFVEGHCPSGNNSSMPKCAECPILRKTAEQLGLDFKNDYIRNLKEKGANGLEIRNETQRNPVIKVQKTSRGDLGRYSEGTYLVSGKFFFNGRVETGSVLVQATGREDVNANMIGNQSDGRISVYFNPDRPQSPLIGHGRSEISAVMNINHPSYSESELADGLEEEKPKKKGIFGFFTKK